MDELQLRMTIERVTLMADAIESHIDCQAGHPENEELDIIVKWLRYRIALRHSAAAQAQAT